MTDVNERVMYVMQASGDTRQVFAENIGINASVISHIASKRNKPSLELLINIINAYKTINLEWLILGKGEMHVNSKPNLEKEVIYNKLKELEIMNEMQYNSTKLQLSSLLTMLEK